MTCEEFQQQVGALALGALEADEAAAVAAHLRVPGEHRGCSEALARARETVAALADTHRCEQPAAAVWDRIEKELGPAEAVAGRPIRRRREAFAWAMAAAAALAAVWLGLRFQGERAARRSDSASAASSLEAALSASQGADAARVACLKDLAALQSDAQLQKDALALLEDPSTRVVHFASQAGDGYRASALWSASTGRALVLSSGLVRKPGSDLELWIIRGDGAPQPAGFLRAHPDGTALGEISRALLADGAPDAFAVSIEPEGGRPTPTQVILLGTLKS